MIKILTAIVLALVVVISTLAVRRSHARSRQRSLSTYNAITSYHKKTMEAPGSGAKFELELDASVNNLHEGDAGYYYLHRMARAAEDLSLREAPLPGISAYEACDMLARRDLNLPFDPKHSYTLPVDMARLLCP